MADISKAYLTPLTDFNLLVVGTWDDASDGILSILHGIGGFNLDYIFISFALTVSPLSLLHLDMGAVTQHNTAKIRCSIRCKDLAPESFGI